MASERYQRLRVLAAGGMGTVHLGRMHGDGGFERLVAIKVMHAHLASDPAFVSMFLDEARLTSSIRHPNVVSTLDVEMSDEGPALVMEYVDGPSLEKLAESYEERGEALPIEVALRLAVDVLSGLHAAHEYVGPDGPAGIVHRDVSPQNVLIGTDGVARITDFGVARARMRLAPATREGEVKGKLAYMSPEQIRAQPIDRRSDIYAVGIVLWELLAGRRLFDGKTRGEIMLKVAAGPVQSPRDANDAVPQAIDDACMRALCKSPDDRWPTAAAFAEALEDAALASGLRIARPRDVAKVIANLDEDGPTRLKPQAAEEWLARVAEQRRAAQGATPAPAAAVAARPATPSAPAPGFVTRPSVAPPSSRPPPSAPPSSRAPLDTVPLPGDAPASAPPVPPSSRRSASAAPLSATTGTTAVGSLAASLVPPSRPRRDAMLPAAAGAGIGLACVAFVGWLILRSPARVPAASAAATSLAVAAGAAPTASPRAPATSLASASASASAPAAPSASTAASASAAPAHSASAPKSKRSH